MPTTSFEPGRFENAMKYIVHPLISKNSKKTPFKILPPPCFSYTTSIVSLTLNAIHVILFVASLSSFTFRYEGQ